MKLSWAQGLAAFLCTYAGPVLADPVGQQIGQPWFVGNWRLGSETPCAELQVAIDKNGSLVGSMSFPGFEESTLRRWRLTPWPNPNTLLATFRDGRIAEYRRIPSFPGEYDFIRETDPQVRRIDIINNDPELVISETVAANDTLPEFGRAMRYSRVERACS
jgi:hypothetical protein